MVLRRLRDFRGLAFMRAASVVAAEATLCLPVGNRLARRLFEFVKVAATEIDGNHRQVFPGRFQRFGVRVLVGVYVLDLTPERMFAAGQESVDPHRRPLTRRDSFDDG